MWTELYLFITLNVIWCILISFTDYWNTEQNKFKTFKVETDSKNKSQTRPYQSEKVNF